MKDGTQNGRIDHLARFSCLSCGAPLPPWFDDVDDPAGDPEDDERYTRWLDTPCLECGNTPRQAGAR